MVFKKPSASRSPINRDDIKVFGHFANSARTLHYGPQPIDIFPSNGKIDFSLHFQALVQDFRARFKHVLFPVQGSPRKLLL
jgi:hypothetical protein